MELEVIQFANSIGANEPNETDEIYGTYRSLFREQNYFRHASGFLIIKISRSKKPFWGLHKEIMDFLNENMPYNLILLQSASQGWVFSKSEVIQNIQSRHWNLESTGQQYKINMPLPDSHMFYGPKTCKSKLGVE